MYTVSLFYFSAKNICRSSLEVPLQGATNKYLHVFVEKTSNLSG